MIAGETETILARQTGADHYDNFLFFGKNKEKKKKEKKELTPEEQEARKAKRQQFWSNVGQQFQEGGTVSNILGLFGAGGGTAQPSDYEFGMGEQNQPSTQDTKKIPTGAIIIGGIVILGIAVYGYTQYQKNQQLKLAQAQ